MHTRYLGFEVYCTAQCTVVGNNTNDSGNACIPRHIYNKYSQVLPHQKC